MESSERTGEENVLEHRLEQGLTGVVLEEVTLTLRSEKEV